MSFEKLKPRDYVDVCIAAVFIIIQLSNNVAIRESQQHTYQQTVKIDSLIARSNKLIEKSKTNSLFIQLNMEDIQRLEGRVFEVEKALDLR